MIRPGRGSCTFRNTRSTFCRNFACSPHPELGGAAWWLNMLAAFRIASMAGLSSSLRILFGTESKSWKWVSGFDCVKGSVVLPLRGIWRRKQS